LTLWALSWGGAWQGGCRPASAAAATAAAAAMLQPVFCEQQGPLAQRACPALHFPPPPAAAQASCRLAVALAEFAQAADSQAGVEQALQLLLLGSRRAAGCARSVADGDAAAPETPPAACLQGCAETGEGAHKAGAAEDGDGAAATAAASVEAVALDLGPAVSLLSAAILQAPRAATAGAAARGAWDTLFDALAPPGLRLACLGRLAEAQHPEVSALLLQRARRDAAAGDAGAGDVWVLCEPWLRLGGARGWRGGGGGGGSGGGGQDDRLVNNANVICAALNTLRLLLLRRQQEEGQGGPSSGSGGFGGSGEGPGPGLPSDSELLASVLEPLQQAVAAALARLRAEASGGGGVGSGGGAAGGGVLLGEGEGTGSLVDAWLALSRVDDVLARVVELCGGGGPSAGGV
jgi:hypothetical protein